MDQEQLEASSQSTARPFREIPAMWLRIGRMTESFFAAEAPHTSARNTFISVLIFTGLSVVWYQISLHIRSIIGLPNPNTSSATVLSRAIPNTAGFLFCYQLVAIPILFYLGNGILYSAAHVFGGKGSFKAQAYLLSLFYLPSVFLFSILLTFNQILFFGTCILNIGILAIEIYIIVLTVRVLKVIHTLTTTKAVISALVPVFLLLIPVCLIAILVLQRH